MVTLPYLRILEFRGADAVDFLHRQLSADIQGLAHGDATFACLCQPKGRVIALLLVLRGPDGVDVACAAALADPVTDWLRRFVFRDDVSLAIAADRVVRGAVDAECADGVEPVPGLRYFLTEPASGEDEELSPEAFRARELAQGVAWLDGKTREQFLPQMLGAEGIGALNYRKGCFPGQEIVARTHYLGRLKQRPLVVDFAAETLPRPMDRVIVRGADQEAEAVVVDGARRGDGRSLALLVVRAAEPFAVERLGRDGAVVPVEARWLDLSQGSATM